MCILLAVVGLVQAFSPWGGTPGLAGFFLGFRRCRGFLDFPLGNEEVDGFLVRKLGAQVVQPALLLQVLAETGGLFVLHLGHDLHPALQLVLGHFDLLLVRDLLQDEVDADVALGSFLGPLGDLSGGLLDLVARHALIGETQPLAVDGPHGHPLDQLFGQREVDHLQQFLLDLSGESGAGFPFLHRRDALPDLFLEVLEILIQHVLGEIVVQLGQARPLDVLDRDRHLGLLAAVFLFLVGLGKRDRLDGRLPGLLPQQVLPQFRIQSPQPVVHPEGHLLVRDALDDLAGDLDVAVHHRDVVLLGLAPFDGFEHRVALAEVFEGLADLLLVDRGGGTHQFQSLVVLDVELRRHLDRDVVAESLLLVVGDVFVAEVRLADGTDLVLLFQLLPRGPCRGSAARRGAAGRDPGGIPQWSHWA